MKKEIIIEFRIFLTLLKFNIVTFSDYKSFSYITLNRNIIVHKSTYLLLFITGMNRNHRYVFCSYWSYSMPEKTFI